MRRRVAAECRCGEESVIRTVTNNTNPNCGKRFLGCKNYITMIKVVVFFKLLDEELTDERDLLIAKLQKKNAKLKHELEKTRSWLKMSLIFGLACFGVCLVLWTILICKISGSWSRMYLK